MIIPWEIICIAPPYSAAVSKFNGGVTLHIATLHSSCTNTSSLGIKKSVQSKVKLKMLHRVSSEYEAKRNMCTGSVCARAPYE